MGPLAGVRVVELAHIMAGPVCGLMLADMGAAVIKVERVPDGDDARRFTAAGVDRVVVSPWRRSRDCVAGLRAFAERVRLGDGA